MRGKASVGKVVSILDAYSDILSECGLCVDRDQVQKHATKGRGRAKSIGRLLKEGRHKPASRRPAPSEVCQAVDGLLTDLIALAKPELRKLTARNNVPTTPAGIRSLVAQLGQKEKQALAQTVLSSSHHKYLKQPDISVIEFQRLLREYCGGETIARGKLISHIQGELRSRGVEMSCDTIEERLRPNTRVKTMPACVRDIIRDLNGRFLTGLIPIEQMTGEGDPKEWLADTRARLRFRSDSAMHKAVAECAGLKYDSVHKALTSPRKGQRIQKKIKECFDQWTAKAAASEELGVKAEYLGVETAEIRQIIDTLSQHYILKEEMYSEIARTLGIKVASVKRYHSARCQTKFVPLENFLRLQTLLAERRERKADSRSYDEHTRELAEKLSERANRALQDWKGDKANVELRHEYRALRLELIELMNEQRAGMNQALAAY